MSDEIYSRLIHFDEAKNIQVRFGVNEFRGVEYLFLRKYYQDMDEEWRPSNEGVNMPLDLNNSRELLAGLVEILSLAESKDVIREHFKELLEETYQ
jgi:hypothetical protein